VSLAGGQGQVKVLSIASGSVTTNFQLPQLSYNGDDTSPSSENGTTWLLRASPRRRWTSRRRSRSARAKWPTPWGTIPSARRSPWIRPAPCRSEARCHLTHPVIAGANQKYYDSCSPWSATSSGLSFTCDDSKLPDAAFPYIIDPTFSSGPTSYDGTYFVDDQEGCCTTDQYTDDDPWNARFDISSIPSNAVPLSVTFGSSSYAWFEGVNSQAAPSCNYNGKQLYHQ